MKPNRKLKKKANTSPKLILEEVIGLTTKNSNGLASSNSNSNSKCVYIAGCVVVVYNVDLGTQSHLAVSDRNPKPLSCVAVSPDGSFIAAGESGHQPAVVVWDFADSAVVSELKVHQYGVACIAFSSDGKYLASVGFPHDGYLCLWHWRSRTLVTKLKACSSCSVVASVSFSSDAKFIITAGRKHLKYWTIGRANTRGGSVVMHGKPVNIGQHKGCSFIDVTSPYWTESGLVGCQRAGVLSPIYALTAPGILYILHAGLSIRNTVDLQVDKAYAVSASNKLVACACNNGVVKLFTVDDLKYAVSLQYTEAKRCNNDTDMDCLAQICENELQPLPSLPDALACQFSTSEKLVVVYGDRSLYIWDISDLHKATRWCVLVSHSSCIWDIKNLPCDNKHGASLACVARGCSGGVSFATCSADGTIRKWDLARQPVLSGHSSTPLTDTNSVATEQVGTAFLVSTRSFECDYMVSAVSTQGFRAIAVSSDGNHLAAGDCHGNLHIYNLDTNDYKCIEGAHNAEILSLSFSMPGKKDVSANKSLKSRYFLASGGQDQIIHLYDVERNFDLVGSVDDHSAAVTSVKLTCNGSKILSCGADRLLVFRNVVIKDSRYKILRCQHQMASRGTVHDMAVDPMVEVVVTVGQDKKLNTYSVGSGKLIRSFKQDTDLGDPLKVTMDPSCGYLVCSYSNRSICVYDFLTGEMVGQGMGHGEVITGAIFLPDCKHLVSVAGDGCIFIWKLPARLSSMMLLRFEENSGPVSQQHITPQGALGQIEFHKEDDHQWKITHKGPAGGDNSNQSIQRRLCQGGVPREASAFKFSISRLPKWAQAKVTPLKFVLAEPQPISYKNVDQEILAPSVDKGGGNAPPCPVLQTPSRHDVEASKQIPESMSKSSCGTHHSQGSTMPQETCGNFALDRRWLTIHTVCLDLLNSPEDWDMRGINVPILASNLSQIPSMENPSNIKCNDELSSNVPSAAGPTLQLCNHVDGHGSAVNRHTKPNSCGSLCKSKNQPRLSNLGTLHTEFDHDVSELLQSDASESQALVALDDNAISNMTSPGNDLCNLNVEDLSAKLKEGRTSSARRTYSGRFFVRQDLCRSQKKLLCTPVEDCDGEIVDRTYGTDPNAIVDRDFEGTKNGAILACKQALLNLDAAAESALHLFSKLRSLPSEGEISSLPEAELFADATEMLPSIAKKVHAVATLLLPTNAVVATCSLVDVHD